jgi:hypothetical protein
MRSELFRLFIVISPLLHPYDATGCVSDSYKYWLLLKRVPRLLAPFADGLIAVLAIKVLLIATAAFALFDVVFFPGMIGDSTTACADSSSDESTLAAASESADDSATRGRSTYDFGAGVVAMVAAGLGAFGFAVFLIVLTENGYECRGEECGGDQQIAHLDCLHCVQEVGCGVFAGQMY